MVKFSDVSKTSKAPKYVSYWREVCGTVDQRSGKWQSKNTTIFVGTIIYQLHVSAMIGHLQVGIRQRKNIFPLTYPNLKMAYHGRNL